MLLSVIIPTRNRAQRLADLLDSLAEQNPVPFEWEVIVVDNASTDDTAEAIRRKSEILPIMIRHVVEPNLGLHHGRHRGAQEARGNYVGYLDDDMILTPTWVQGVEMVAQGNADAVVGRIFPKWEAEPPDWLQLMLQQDNGSFGYLGLLDLGADAKPVDPYLVWAGNCFLPRRLVFDLLGFHPDGMPAELLRYRGDGETALMRKFKQAGLTAYYDPKATVYHVISSERMTVEYMCKRAYNQGISDSFSKIRSQSERTNSGCKQLRKTSLPSIAKAMKKKAKSLAYHIGILNSTQEQITALATPRDGVEPNPLTKEVRQRLDASYRMGWQFHQDEVKKDPELLAYVLKPTYINPI